jgi:uncharacterized phiE125 gp8 family phage protein
VSVVTLDEVKTHLNLTEDTNDTELQDFLDAAEAAIAAQVGPLESEERTDRVRSAAGSLVLPVSPVVSVTSAANADTTALTVDDLYLDGAAGVVSFLDGATLVTPGFYDITYVAGRETCPPDLKLAVKELVRHLWQTQRGPTNRPGARTSDAVTSRNIPPGAAYLLPFRVMELLAPHIQPGIA